MIAIGTAARPLQTATPQRQTAAPQRQSYAARAGDVVDLINRIASLNGDPHAFHEAKDAAVRKARALQLALASDAL